MRGAPAGHAGEGAEQTDQPKRPAQGRWRGTRRRDEREAPGRPGHAFDVTDVLDPEALVRLGPRQHLELDQGGGERLAVRFHQGAAPQAEIDRRRAALAMIECLGRVERVEILVDVDVVMRNVKPPQEALRAARVLAPVGAVDSNHECVIRWMVTVR